MTGDSSGTSSGRLGAGSEVQASSEHRSEILGEGPGSKWARVGMERETSGEVNRCKHLVLDWAELLRPKVPSELQYLISPDRELITSAIWEEFVGRWTT